MAAATSAAVAGDRLVQPLLDFARERAQSPFVARELTYLLDGGPRVTASKEFAMRQMERLPWLSNAGVYDEDRGEARVRTMAQIKTLFRAFIADYGDLDLRNARVSIASLSHADWITRNGIHFGLFVNAISSQGTPEQQDEWLVLAMSLQIFGCFAMTELRGGSYVKGLQTRATYIPPHSQGGDSDAADGEFEVHTPFVEATKWWIGGAGETATHAAVYARLISRGIDHGVHTFIVPLRDVETHAPLKGVAVGDVGAKFGRNGIDNGWIQFNRVRIPRANMLARHGAVAVDGTYSRPPTAKPQLAYAALVMGRATMVQTSADALQLATTIAVRWAVARRQGAPLRTAADSSPSTIGGGGGAGAGAGGTGGRGIGDGVLLAAVLDAAARSAEPLPGKLLPPDASALHPGGVRGPPRELEPQLLDYTTHQHKLMPLVATAVAFTFTAHRMAEMYENLMAGLDSDDATLLPDVHATSAGLKAFTTWAAHYGIDTCRQACGGHGYSAYSRLPSLFADFAVMCTWEGDNTVMALQTARYLVGSLAKVRGVSLSARKAGKARGKARGGGDGGDGAGGGDADGGSAAPTLQGSVRYLTDSTLGSVCPAATAAELLDPNVQLAALRWRARTAVTQCADALTAAAAPAASGGGGLSEGEAWNANAVALVDASRAHVYLNIAACFAVAVARRGVLEQERGIAVYGRPGEVAPGATVDILTGRRVDDSDFTRVSGRDGASAAGFGRFREDKDGPLGASSPEALAGVASAAKSSTTASAGAGAGGGAGSRGSSRTRGRVRGARSAAPPPPAPSSTLSSLIPVPTAEVTETPLYPTLKLLLDLFVLHHILADAGFYLRYGYLTPTQVKAVEAHVAALVAAARRVALPLTDAFNLSNSAINSPLGRGDGDVYGAYMARVRAVPEATQSAALGPALAGRAPYFEALIKPTLSGEDMAAAMTDSAMLQTAGKASDEEWAAYAASSPEYAANMAAYEAWRSARFYG